MRTVTFSDERVVNYVNRHFVAVWKNIRPQAQFRDGIYDGERGDVVVTKTEQGAGDDNICAHLATADGKILHAVQGHARSERFLQELKFAVSIAELAPEKLTEAYSARSKQLEQQRDAGAKLLRRNLLQLAGSPLPLLDSVKDAKRAGLR
jgi:hypothetical protein